MRIRMNVQMSGTRNGEPWPARGEVTELPTAEAAHLVASGIAEEVVDEPAKVETATMPKADTSAPPQGAETKPRTTAKRAASGRKGDHSGE
ncbi:hypothetical protein [Streptomyces sp. NPDC127084]|uniref:hypothetical protein n=1 Tax=Streptomyces sp. NPDC127084 TaxID=3347133 RepID=UPI0036695732